MKLKELWELSPQAVIYVVRRSDDFSVVSRKEYSGGKIDGERLAKRIVPTSYPMMKHVLEVELR